MSLKKNEGERIMNHKKVGISAVLVALCILAIMIIFIGCSSKTNTVGTESGTGIPVTMPGTSSENHVHTEITVPGIFPGCTESGLTDGKKCSVCGKITVEQQIIPAKGHTYFNGICADCGTAITISENLDYKLNSDKSGYLVAGVGTCLDKDILIPESYNGKPVTGISRSAFYGCSSLRSITIPESVTRIESYAFYNCSGLTSITIPENVNSIDMFAFYGCNGLASITIPSGITNISYRAFSGCSGLANITIPDSVAIIGYNAFENCSSLASITMPDGVTAIGSGAFYGCSGLKNITIPDSITLIGDNAFYGCSGLTSITIPGSVTNIRSGAFKNCSSLESITIPDSVIGIGEDAFADTKYYNDDSNWEDGVLYIGKHLIDTKLSELPTAYQVKEGTLTIACYAFSDCNNLKNIAISDSITVIGDYAFYNCDSLTSITISSGVTGISHGAFKNCSSLESIFIPSGAISIGSEAFANTKHYNDDSNWENGVLYIGKHLIDTKPSELSAAYQIKEGTLTIADSAFSGCSGLTSINIPGSVINAGKELFSACSSLTSITIPSGVTIISDCAFCSCSSLTGINISGSVTVIGDSAFLSCEALESITFNGTMAQWNRIYNGFEWNGNSGNYTVYCTDGNLEKY